MVVPRSPPHASRVVSPAAHRSPACGSPIWGRTPSATVRDGLRRVDLVGIDDRILDAAGMLEPQILGTLDAIHLATAMALGDDLEAILTYDDRMISGARLLGLTTATPR
ncbi:MAG: PIN domain-containing protein, partial [Actinomycetia bacterium]|nr:PIN domain-containing protein [Actinomycetes bacterium]